MSKNNQFIITDSSVPENSFNFYNKGKELWKQSYDIQDEMEDKLRHQLERSGGGRSRKADRGR